MTETGFAGEDADRLRPVLLAALGVDADELALNRAGHRSRRQRRREVRALVWSGVVWLVVTLGLGSCFGAFFLAPDGRDPAQWNPPASYLVLIRGGALLSATLLGRQFDRIRRGALRLGTGTPVQRLTGWPVVDPGTEDESWTVSLAGHRFAIPSAAAPVFDHPGRYALYHAGERLLSAEPVAEVGAGVSATPDPVPEPFPWFTLAGLLGFVAASLAAPPPPSGTFDTWSRPASVAAAVLVGLAVVALRARRRARVS